MDWSEMESRGEWSVEECGEWKRVEESEGE